jgi:ferredoxin
MRATVDADLCTGCELCTETCPEIFEMQGEVAVTSVDVIPVDAVECARQAAEECPVEAIALEE